MSQQTSVQFNTGVGVVQVSVQFNTGAAVTVQESVQFNTGVGVVQESVSFRTGFNIIGPEVQQGVSFITGVGGIGATEVYGGSTYGGIEVPIPELYAQKYEPYNLNYGQCYTGTEQLYVKKY